MKTVEKKILAFEQIGEISKNGVFIYNISTSQFEYINKVLAKLFGFPVKELLVHPLHILEKIEPDDLKFLEALVKKVTSTPHLTDIEINLKNEHQKIISVDAYYFETENILAGLVKDISPQKEHEQYIINYGAKKNTLLEMLAHNLSGPLKLSQKVMEFNQSKHKRSAITVEEQLAFAKSVNEQCIDTIYEFLKEEHFVSERIFVKRNRFDVVDKLNVVVNQYRKSHPGRDIQTNFPTDPVFVFGDDVKFMQIVNNLVSNALKFTPANCQIDVELTETENIFKVFVRDDGIGIPKHLQPLIFQKYSSAGRVGLNGEKSMGVGLSITKKLVELMKGKIEFTSAENKGTTFILTVPKF
jgi:two-component system, OmpR family, sensor histidine kinase VicK